MPFGLMTLIWSQQADAFKAYQWPMDGPPLETKRDLSAWLSHDDAVHLIDRAIQADIEGSFVAQGISNNRFKRLDLTETRKILGYNPQDDAFETFPIPSK